MNFLQKLITRKSVLIDAILVIIFSIVLIAYKMNNM
jgi:hypothetical protein